MNTQICRRVAAIGMVTLLCCTAVSATALQGAAGSTQVVLSGDVLRHEPTAVETNEINGAHIVTKTFKLTPDIDPAQLREADFTLDGYTYTYDEMKKQDEFYEDGKTVRETVEVDSLSKELAAVLKQFPSTKAYAKDGYSGTLILDVQSIQTQATGYTTHTSSRPHTVTRNYSLSSNDPSGVPKSVQSNGRTLPQTSLTFTRNNDIKQSDVPGAWTATATYSKTTYSSSSTANGYKSTAVYIGEVSKSGIQSVVYTVMYRGSKIPIAPFLPASVTVPQFAITVALLAAALIALIVWLTWYHTARIFVFNEEKRIHDVVSRQLVSVKTPRVKLAVLQGHAQTEYTVMLTKRLAKRLVGRDIAVSTGGEPQHHMVETFVGNDYSFVVRI